MGRIRVALAAALLFGLSAFVPAAGAQQFFVKPVAEKKIRQLPPGPLFWRIENVETLEKARAAEGPNSLAIEMAGKVWLFTLDAAGGATAGASRVAEIGPVPAISAPEYLLRINHAGGPPGAKTALHTHPGSESFFVLAGRLGQKTPQGENMVDAGGTLNGKGPGTQMEVFSAGTTDLQALVMFVVDATQPFSSTASIK